MEIHVVQPGETIAGIAAIYGISESRLIFDNQLEGQSRLVEGQALLILIPEQVHQVAASDILYSISSRYGISILTLYRNNPYLLTRPGLIPGDFLVIRYQGEQQGPLEVFGYAYPFISPPVLEETLLYLNELMVFSYGFTPEGDLIPPVDEFLLLDAAERFGVDPVLVLTPLGADGRFSNLLVNQVLGDIAVQDRLINQLLTTVQVKGYAGVDVDFEFILPQDRERYAEFVGRIRQVMAPEGVRVSVALAPKNRADQPGLLYEGMDYRLLGENADSVLLMTYEWGYKYGPPLAVAPLNQVRRVVDYAITEIPVEKIFLGVPNYAYDWPLPYERDVTEAATIGNVEAVRIAERNNAVIQWDEVAQSPYFTYELSGVTHEVWFEDVRSIQAKLELAQSYGLRGVGYWNIMRPFRANWLLINMWIIPE